MRHAGSLASTLGGAIAALGLTVLSAPSQAAPASGLAGAAAGDSTQVEQIRHRCYRHRGHWHCPSHGYRHYDGPGIYFNFGPRRHFHRHRHHRHGH
jgi:hypothetical protein